MSKIYALVIVCVAIFAGFVVYQTTQNLDSAYDSVDLAKVPTERTGIQIVSTTTSEKTAPKTDTKGDLSFDGSYKLIDVNGKKVLSERIYTLVLSSGRMIGQICNSYSAEYLVSRNTLQVNKLVSTKMACADESGEYEKVVFGILQNKPTISLKNKTLKLSAMGQSVFFKLE